MRLFFKPLEIEEIKNNISSQELEKIDVNNTIQFDWDNTWLVEFLTNKNFVLTLKEGNVIILEEQESFIYDVVTSRCYNEEIHYSNNNKTSTNIDHLLYDKSVIDKRWNCKMINKEDLIKIKDDVELFIDRFSTGDWLDQRTLLKYTYRSTSPKQKFKYILIIKINE
jgi:hypothetical protein